MIKELLRTKFSKIFVAPGDKVQLTYKEAGQPDLIVAEIDITESDYFDTGVIISVENELGLRKGIGGLFGREE